MSPACAKDGDRSGEQWIEVVELAMTVEVVELQQWRLQARQRRGFLELAGSGLGGGGHACDLRAEGIEGHHGWGREGRSGGGAEGDGCHVWGRGGWTRSVGAEEDLLGVGSQRE